MSLMDSSEGTKTSLSSIFFSSGDLGVDLRLKSFRGSRDRSVFGDLLNKFYGGLNETVRLQLRNFVL